jgi:hypothetical protein
MSQNDFNIANQTASVFRADLNSALAALASLSSGATAPSTTYGNMMWYDTANNILKLRTEANDGWINIGYMDQGAGAFRILDDTQVTNTSGTQTGLIGGQATAAWEAGTGTTESLVSPANIKSAIDAQVPFETGAGAVGTYLFGGTGLGVPYGTTIAGSSLYPTGTTKGSSSGTNEAPNSAVNGNGDAWMSSHTTPRNGTWRCMGHVANSGWSQSLFLRIA